MRVHAQMYTHELILQSTGLAATPFFVEKYRTVCSYAALTPALLSLLQYYNL